VLPAPLSTPRHRCARAVITVLAVLGTAACGTTPALRAGLESAPVAGTPEGAPGDPAAPGAPRERTAVHAELAGRLVAQAPPPALQDLNEVEQYDPWEPFNEKMFEFNYRLDRYVLKPVANVYRKVIPEGLQVLIANGFDNLRWVPRFVNSLLQGKFEGAGRELGRFLINSTLGLGGLFDPAKDYWGIQPSREDFGQTLGVWGTGPGPYLVLPLLDPMTVRDGIGRGVDAFLDPLSYVLPFVWERLALRAGETVNERALNYELFQGVEETTLDLYSSVRHFYLQRRERLIRE
jgi:phospholipid-binding lipoprotein MlaA